MLKRRRSLSLGLVVMTAAGSFAVTALLGACGQKGPLTLAQPASTASHPSTPIAAAASAPASSPSALK